MGIITGRLSLEEAAERRLWRGELQELRTKTKNESSVRKVLRPFRLAFN